MTLLCRRAVKSSFPSITCTDVATFIQTPRNSTRAGSVQRTVLSDTLTRTFPFRLVSEEGGHLISLISPPFDFFREQKLHRTKVRHSADEDRSLARDSKVPTGIGSGQGEPVSTLQDPAVRPRRSLGKVQ